MITLEEAQGALVIDTKKLDEECRFQPELFYEVAKQSVEAASERDALKETKDRVWSSTFVKEKMEGKLEGKSLSDKTAETFADVDEEVVKAIDSYLGKKKEADEWTALKEAYQQRAVMLKELCGLQISGGYGEIAVKSKVVEDTKYDKIRKKMRDGI